MEPNHPYARRSHNMCNNIKIIVKQGWPILFGAQVQNVRKGPYSHTIYQNSIILS
jgi:hypothetical protein